MGFLAGLAIIVGLMVLVSFGFAKTFLWNNYDPTVSNILILIGLIAGIVMFATGIIVLSFLSKELPQRQVVE